MYQLHHNSGADEGKAPQFIPFFAKDLHNRATIYRAQTIPSEAKNAFEKKKKNPLRQYFYENPTDCD